MPNRILREGILTSETINKLSEGAEVFYRRLLSAVDDFGRFHAHPDLLRAALFPLKLSSVSSDKVTAWLEACQQAGAVTVYEKSGMRYVHIEKFENGQRLRAKHSKFPSPDGQVTVIRPSTRQPDPPSFDGHARAESDAETYSDTYADAYSESLNGYGHAAPQHKTKGVRAPSCCDCQSPGAGKFQGATYCAKHLVQRQGSAAAVESFPPCATCGKPGTHPFRGNAYCLAHSLEAQRNSPAIPGMPAPAAILTAATAQATAAELDDDIPF